MNRNELFALLEIPAEVAPLLPLIPPVPAEVRALFLDRASTARGLEALKAVAAPDPHGLRMASLMLDMAAQSWPEYEQRGISREIFAETMKFVPRFLRSFERENGHWGFTQAWWFWRQLALVEFRVGELEYEFVEENGLREIALHIPGDADMSPAAIDASLTAFRAFQRTYFPDWGDAAWTCDSWMLSPALPSLLDEGSKVLAFNRRFQVTRWEEDSLGVLDWVFPPHREITPDLPEGTSLQRRMKAWLLAGNKVGWTKGFMRSVPE